MNHFISPLWIVSAALLFASSLLLDALRAPFGQSSSGGFADYGPIIVAALGLIGTIVTGFMAVYAKVSTVQQQVKVTDQKIDITSARVDGKLTELMAALEEVNIAKGVEQERARAATEQARGEAIASQVALGVLQAQTAAAISSPLPVPPAPSSAIVAEGVNRLTFPASPAPATPVEVVNPTPMPVRIEVVPATNSEPLTVKPAEPPKES